MTYIKPVPMTMQLADIAAGRVRADRSSSRGGVACKMIRLLEPDAARISTNVYNRFYGGTMSSSNACEHIVFSWANDALGRAPRVSMVLVE